FSIKCVAAFGSSSAFGFSNLGAQSSALGFQQQACALEFLRELCLLLNRFLQSLLVLFSELFDDFAAYAFLFRGAPPDLLMASLDFRVQSPPFRGPFISSVLKIAFE